MSLFPVHARSRPLNRAAILGQLLLTAAILGMVPGNVPKLLLMLLVWGFGFGRLSRGEVLMMLGVNLLFFVMNAGALQKGIFRFQHPDFLGMPVYEYFMWGFYTLNVIRFMDAPPSPDRRGLVVVFAVLFSIPFSTIADSTLLLAVTAAILGLSLVFFHEAADLAFTAYMVAMGALIEYVGVWTGQWSYPANPVGGVPLWFITMWGGVGLFSRRLLTPLLPRAR